MTWKIAQLTDIPALGPAATHAYWARWTDAPGFGARWHSVRRHFGIEGFGVNANEADAGDLLVLPHAGHDHAEQEEIYFIVRGRAKFACDGECVEVGEGQILYVAAETHREAIALQTPTVVFMVGGIPGEPYTPSR